MTLLLPAAAGLLIAALSGLAGASMRRLAIGAGIGLLIAFAAFPLTELIGFLSRQSLQPTPLALVPVSPSLAGLAVAALLASLGTALPGRSSGAAVTVAGVVGFVVLLTWTARSAQLTRIVPLGGLMEVVTGLTVLFLAYLVSRNRKRLRWPLLLAGLLAGAAVTAWFSSPVGQNLFPNVQGYFKLVQPVSAGVESDIVAAFNRDLPAVNLQRESLGLNPLSPLDSITGLEGQRIPREAAAEGFRLLTPADGGYGRAVIVFLLGLMSGAGVMLLWRPWLQSEGDVAGGVLLAAVVSVLAPAFAATDFSFDRLAAGWPFLLNFLDRAWPPEFGALQEVASQMLITLEIALVGTFLAALFAVPLSFLAASNLTRNHPAMRLVFAATRGFFNLDRGVDTLILALVFVAAVGLGPFAGVLAMAIHSIADLGKLYSESIENVLTGPIEALESVGGSGTAVVRWAVLPQVAPLFVAWTLYRFEINFRVSIVLGLVGAGGIGFFIQEKMGTGAYDQMLVAIIAIVLVVNIIDFTSSWLRGLIT